MTGHDTDFTLARRYNGSQYLASAGGGCSETLLERELDEEEDDGAAMDAGEAAVPGNALVTMTMPVARASPTPT